MIHFKNIWFLLFAIVLCICQSAFTQSINFRFNNYFYAWQRLDSLSDTKDAKTVHLRGYQNYLFELKANQWSFNFLAQTEEDLINKVGRGFGYRLYNAYIKGSNLFNILDLKLGRQNIFAGTGRGTIDGLFLKFKAGKFKQYQFSLYGGVIAPYSYNFDKYPEIKNNYQFGAMLSYYGVKDLIVSLSYNNKKRNPESYKTFRADSIYNLEERTISFDAPATQLAGLDFNYVILGKHNVFGKAYYNFTMKKLYRAEINLRAKLTNDINAFAEYLFREPQFNYNSIFWVFSYRKNQEVSAGADYTFKNGIAAYIKASAVFYDNVESDFKTDNKSFKIQAGFNNTDYGLNFTRFMGYAGESDGVSAYYRRVLLKNPYIAGNVHIDFSRYVLGDYDVKKVNAFSSQIGFTYRPIQQFSIDLQGQYLFNRIYKSDLRVLAGFSYWLFKKF